MDHRQWKGRENQNFNLSNSRAESPALQLSLKPDDSFPTFEIGSPLQIVGELVGFLIRNELRAENHEHQTIPHGGVGCTNRHIRRCEIDRDLNKTNYSRFQKEGLTVVFLANPYTGGSAYASMGKFDHELCGHSKLPCGVIHRAHNIAKESSVKSYDAAVIVQTDFDLTESVTSMKPITWTSSSSQMRTISTATSTITVESETFTAHTLHFTPKIIQTSPTLFAISGTGSLVISSSKLSSFTLDEPLIKHEGASVEITGTAIEHITLSTTSAIVASKPLTITHSFFTSCSSTANGGVFFFEQANHIVIRNSSFTSCSSGGHGGCCFVSLSPTQNQWDFEVDATFIDCSCGEGKHGKWIHFTHLLFPPILDTRKWPAQKNGLTLANRTLFTAQVENQGVASPIDLIDFLVFTPSTTIHVSNSKTGSTLGSCGSQSSPCCSLDVGLNRLSEEHSGTIRVVDNTTFNFTSPIEHDVLISSSSAGKATIFLTQPPEVVSDIKLHCFSSLTLDSLLFCVLDGLLRITCLINSNDGTLIVSNCDFREIELLGVLLDISSSHAEIRSTVFDQIKADANGYSGAVILSASLNEDASLLMDDVTIVSPELVDTQNGLYSGIEARITQTAGTPVFSFTNFKFLPDSGSPSSRLHFVTIVGEDLKTLIEFGDSRFEGSYETVEEGTWLWGINTEGASTRGESLLYSLVGTGGAVGVSSDGEDSEECGYFGDWCRTLSRAVGLAKTKMDPAVSVQGRVEIGSSITAKTELLIKGRTQNDGLEFLNELHLDFSGEQAIVTFDTLEMEIKSTFEDRSVITLNVGAHLKLNNLKIAITAPQSKPFVTSQKSKLSLTEISLNGHNSEISDSHFLFMDGELSVLKSLFDKVASNPAGSHSPFSLRAVDKPSSFSIGSIAAQTTFSDFVGAEKGGALGIEVSNDESSVSIVNTLFQNCHATHHDAAILREDETSVDSLPSTVVNFEWYLALAECLQSQTVLELHWTAVQPKKGFVGLLVFVQMAVLGAQILFLCSD
ncbi:hypothetical protein BLNAU_17990 [Blattamonas nauphoetae]|uniref:Uncharacterized protein n=1 Tax=Blattamonas nauphoetae TaxID=2049346 RepID=A0ABQ9X8R0_9EUKA|nr:hypothetical protein BLNAU_17990 [Blattamonas nauphoetae]